MKICLPLLAWDHQPAPDILSVEALGEGDFCICYLVNRTHVLRLAKHAEASAALRREMSLLPLLQRGVEVHIPQFQGAGTQADTGERFVYYPIVPGAPIEAEALSLLEQPCRSELVRQMAAFAAQLHRFPVDQARACGVREINPHRYIRELMRSGSRELSHRLDAAVWRYHERLVEFYFANSELHTYKPALLHGDLSPDHFLVDPEGCALMGVIDFGDSFIGDPHRDLIFVLEDYGVDILDLFLTFYSPDTRQQASTRVRIFQQLNTVEYCLSQFPEGDKEEQEEAIDTLVRQATSEAVI